MIDEILVHIATPATRQNDQLYRSLADAYISFEPHQTFGDGPRQDLNGQDPSSISRLDDSVVPNEGYPGSVPAGSSILSTSKESYGSFPSYLSSGIHQEKAENVNTYPRCEPVDDESVPTGSRLARLECIHKRWKEQTTPKSSFVNRQTSTTRILSTPDDADTAFIEDTQLGAQALQSQLQDSYSTTSEDTSDDEAERDIPVSNVLFDHDIRGNTGPKEVLLPASTCSTQLATPVTTSERHPTLPGLEVTPQISSLLSQAPNKKHEVVETNRHPTEAFDFSALPIDAFPPAPKITTEHPGKLPSQITKHLTALKSQNPKRFNPSKKHGLPKPDDRGYWSITCSSWPTRSQHDFWISLYEHVSSGRLGWGTTLYRDAPSSHTLGQVRLYCWAEVIEHMWLLLWFCSKGEIVGSGSRWMDADGKVVFEVS
jgi:hypothetical protein